MKNFVKFTGTNIYQVYKLLKYWLPSTQDFIITICEHLKNEKLEIALKIYVNEEFIKVDSSILLCKNDLLFWHNHDKLLYIYQDENVA